MSDGLQNGSALQFGTAQYQEQTGGDRCRICGQPLAGEYFWVNGTIGCRDCSGNMAGQLARESRKPFSRAVLFGIGGAILGLILYSVVGIVTGLEIGYVSFAVGYIVGNAIKLGSKGTGGPRYQIAALVLTYVAVSLSAVPIAMSQFVDLGNVVVTQGGQPAASTAGSTSLGSFQDSQMTFGGLVAYLGVLALASPLLILSDPLQGLIKLVILFAGLRIAWRLTKGARVGY